MTRFSRGLSERLDRDLSQIADQATPSSTAWEAIRHRIDEQDSRAASGTERTMEVIMLDPDTNRLAKKRPTGLLVAACLATVALVGGLVVIGTRDDGGAPADEPIVTTAPDTGDDSETVDVDGETGGPVDETSDGVVPVVTGEVLPPVEPARAGSGVAECAFGSPVDSPDGSRTTLEQTCTFEETANSPFETTQNIELTIYNSLAAEPIPSAPYTSAADTGLLSAGYSYADGEFARFVGIAPGAGVHEGEQVFITGLGEGDVDATFDWTLDETLPTPPRGSDSSPEFVAEVTFECDLANAGFDEQGAALLFDQVCIFSGDDSAYVPVPLAGPLRQFALDPTDAAVVPEQGGITFITTVLAQDTLISGLMDGDGAGRFVSVWPGNGVLDGTLVHGVGRFDLAPDEADPDRAMLTGVMQVTALPIDS